LVTCVLPGCAAAVRLQPSLSPAGPPVLTTNEANAVRGLLHSILEYVDRYTRYGCGDTSHSDYFSQYPKLALTIRQQDFPSDVLKDLRREVRMSAPAVMLVPGKNRDSDTFRIDVLNIDGAEGGLAKITYRHSAFGFELSSFTSLGFARDDGPRATGAARQMTSTAFVGMQPFFHRALMLQDNQVTPDIQEVVKYGKLAADDAEFKAVAEAVRVSELGLRKPIQPVSYEADRSVTVFRFSPAVFVAVLRPYHGEDVIEFAGVYRTYVLSREAGELKVAGSAVTHFTDVAISEVCNEPDDDDRE
jgi:hypothetical protein